MLLLNSYAKLNLYLEVLNLRQDKYHNIKTLFERIGLHDTIILKSRRDKLIKIICNSHDVPCDNRNLAYQSARLLRDNFKINQGVDIKIIKRIPVGSGLGGGSSNAATVLMGLNKLWGLNLTQNKLVSFAKIIGSDVPFFIYNIPFAFGHARGDKISPLEAFSRLRLWHILAVPRIKVSTPLVYRKWDAECSKTSSCSSALTRPKYDAKILNLALRKIDLGLLSEVLFNRLESITIKLYPEVRRIKEKLINLGLKAILMSGSGPAVFAIISSRKEALSLRRRLKAGCRLWRVFVTSTV